MICSNILYLLQYQITSIVSITVDNRITVGYEPGTNIRGMITTDDIPKGTILIHTPGSLVVSAQSTQCQTIANIVKEMNSGVESKWKLYFDYDDSSGSHIPSQWDRSESGRAIQELQGLPPSGDTHRHLDWYQSACIGEGKEMSDVEMKAFKMFLTRAADIGLVPMYDLMNHHNGKINTKLQRDESGGLKVIASHDIPANYPIYNTYARSGIESTVEVFNTYGFVEDYPQLWRWSDVNLAELIKENEKHAHSRYSDEYLNANNEPNTHHYEVLVITPSLAALHPTKQLVSILGNGQRSLDEWQQLIKAHHINLRESHARSIHGSAASIREQLATSIEEDISLIPLEKRRLEKVKRMGRIDMKKADAIQATEFRLAFKKALRLAMKTAEQEAFLKDSEEL